jgi:hypothetical protein
MARLDEFKQNAAVRGILPDGLVTVTGVQWFGSEARELTYKDPSGRIANRLLYRHDEPHLEIVEQGRLIRAPDQVGSSAAALVAKLGPSKADAARELAYNGLVRSWPETARLARRPKAEQTAMFGEVE